MVVGRALQIEIVSADLAPQRSRREHETAGGVEFAFLRKPGEEVSDAVERKMAFSFAGIWAEHHILGIEAESLEEIGNQSDDLDVAECAAKCARKNGVSEEEIGRRWSAAWGSANELTNRFRSEIIKLANELDEHRSLSSEQIHEVLKDTCFS